MRSAKNPSIDNDGSIRAPRRMVQQRVPVFLWKESDQNDVFAHMVKPRVHDFNARTTDATDHECGLGIVFGRAGVASSGRATPARRALGGASPGRGVTEAGNLELRVLTSQGGRWNFGVRTAH